MTNRLKRESLKTSCFRRLKTISKIVELTKFLLARCSGVQNVTFICALCAGSRYRELQTSFHRNSQCVEGSLRNDLLEF